MSHHFLNLLFLAWSNLLASLGTTTLSIVLFTLAVPVITFCLRILYLYRSSPRETLKAYLNDALIPTAIGLAVPIVLLLVLFGWNTANAVYNDHQDLVSKNQLLLKTNAALVDPKSRDDEIAQLKGKLEEQKTGKYGKPDPAKAPSMQVNANGPNGVAVGSNPGTINVNPPINQNQPIVTYDCGGQKHTHSSNMFSSGPGQENDAFTVMSNLSNSKSYPELLKECNSQINTKRDGEWLTPYLFCSYAEFQTRNIPKSKEFLSYYDNHKGPNYDVGDCQAVSDYLHGNLK
jgi:hypothetical protein